jgi:hypothetical protein
LRVKGKHWPCGPGSLIRQSGFFFPIQPVIVRLIRLCAVASLTVETEIPGVKSSPILTMAWWSSMFDLNIPLIVELMPATKT